MQRRELIKLIAAALPALGWHKNYAALLPVDTMRGGTGEKMAEGPFKPNWASLEQYKTPAWFTRARFGIWAHWGAQCQAEYGDWYARGMYQEGSDQYKYHISRFGHPSKFGFKDVIHEWKGENWDPDQLVGLYKNAGAQYFMAMANHHDDFDNYNSKYQPWNAVKMGPKKDLIGGWAKAAQKHGLPFGVSVHASHAWNWYEVSQRSDKNGPLAGVPYDGKTTKADGKGTWWNGFDPQDLYTQNHPLSENSADNGMIHKQWNWDNGVAQPSAAWCENFYNRTVDLINKYHPDLVYFDDTALPFWPVNDAGLRIAAHMYNESIQRKGRLDAVIFGKILNEQQRKCLVWDVEKGTSNNIEPFVWQTDTCIGDWHYNRRVYDRKGYKTAGQVIRILMDVVSKNGNLLLNIPVRANGTIDELEQAVVAEIGEWMKINSEAVYGTMPWKVFGEGPAIASADPLKAQGFNEGKIRLLATEDFRFTQKDGFLYATFFGWPESKKVVIKSLAGQAFNDRGPGTVKLLGSDAVLTYEQGPDGLAVHLPDNAPGKNAYVLKISHAAGTAKNI
ncbi:MAG TPA: alpha-L-fucosidase [Chitinophagaceae bacterium]|nr:alpha-L-fucosidase [Chitinophagaceae bacterium]